MENTSKFHKNKAWLIAGVVYAIAVLFILFIINLDSLNAALDTILTVLRPVIIGLVLAYFCNPMFRLFERRLLFHVRPTQFRRILSLILTYIVVFLILVFFLLLLIPQLISSVSSFLENKNIYLDSFVLTGE